ncbi:hypothetical protein KIPB_011442, partial [Kipferlia bialata]
VNTSHGMPNPFNTLYNTHKSAQAWWFVKLLLFPLQVLRVAIIFVDLIIAPPLFFLVLLGHDQESGPPTGIRGVLFRGLARGLSRIYLFVMGYFHIKHINRHNEDKTGALIVSNHVSGTDAVLLMSQLAPAFVAKAEVKNWFAFGKLATGLRSLYIERRDDKKVAGAMTGTEAIANRVQTAKPTDPPLVIFPEGEYLSLSGLSLPLYVYILVF